MPRNVAILVFDDVEVLDFCGPFEVFSVCGQGSGESDFWVYTVAEKATITARNGLSVNPRFALEECPPPEILVVPGGGGFDADGNPFGSRKEMNNPVLLDWLARMAKPADIVLSVCTGALILAQARLLEGLAATTHHLSLDLLAEVAPNTKILSDQRIVDNGKVVASGGISAGIDAAFYVVARLLGEAKAQETADYMEYDWKPLQLPTSD